MLTLIILTKYIDFISALRKYDKSGFMGTKNGLGSFLLNMRN